MDILTIIYNALIADDHIKEKVAGRIKYYQFPATDDVEDAHIVIDPLDVPIPKDFADETWLTEDYLVQIEVWTKNRLATAELSSKVQQAMWKIGFSQGSGMNEYDRETGIYRDARQYRGKVYREDVTI
ncbi:DUF3168 domain-containing protein [Fictibacillus fluitans]|uniref:DUF3168 domain-containing protein n=1 Tax=Fictibacillus fluitans TaxID=3058422 RepID=A0ABT8HX67_9BACL|nr:DUF3168 domain-containing protein [Fictibacillus sp. NE201]MDN4525323.1 DUF3168 domain-containing protein [Fictibacillus sp. NE201]